MFKKSAKDSWLVVKRGNMLMLAIGLLLGASFNGVMKSLANDVIMAAIASAFNVDGVEKLTAGPVLIGKFLAALISFLIVSFLIFIILFLVFLFRNISASIKSKKKLRELVDTKENELSKYSNEKDSDIHSKLADAYGKASLVLIAKRKHVAHFEEAKKNLEKAIENAKNEKDPKPTIQEQILAQLKELNRKMTKSK